MNDSAPPPPAAPPHAGSGHGSAPQSWQDPSDPPYSPRPQAPAFNPRRAVRGAGTTAAHQDINPVMAPPPLRPTDLSHRAPSPYAPPMNFDDTPVPGPPPHRTTTHGTPPAFAAQPYARAHYEQNFAAPPPVFVDPQSGGPREPTKDRSSLWSKLTGRAKKDLSKIERSEGRPDNPQWHDHSAQTPPAYAAAPNYSAGVELEPAEHSARKPFLMGLLTGVVVMLILGQIFRAASPSDDYAQALPPINMTVTDSAMSDDPDIVAFLDTVDGLE